MKSITCGRLLVDAFGEAGEVEITQYPTSRFGGPVNGPVELPCDMLKDWIESLETEYFHRRVKLWKWIDEAEPTMGYDDRIKLEMVKARHPRPDAEEIQRELAYDGPKVKYRGKSAGKSGEGQKT